MNLHSKTVPTYPRNLLPPSSAITHKNTTGNRNPFSHFSHLTGQCRPRFNKNTLYFTQYKSTRSVILLPWRTTHLADCTSIKILSRLLCRPSISPDLLRL
jgi:hypothetical protein